MRHLGLTSLMIASLLAACGPLGGSPTAARKPTTPKATADAGPGIQATTPVIKQTGGGANVVSDNGGGILSNNSSSLTGTFSAPASLIANNGGNIITNNGGNIIANNSGGYHLLAAVQQSPLANATVRLLDAAGQPVQGSDGKPLTAMTDAKGQYAFTAKLPAQNLVVQVDLADGKGSVRAFVPRDGGDQRAASGDLISSLSTSYILSQYVRSQSSPNSVFEKLPSDVEKATRDKTAAAVTANGQAPATLQDADVVKAVDALRQRDADLNGQMETVKKLLVAAGASDLGSGTPGTQVSLRAVDALAAGKNGEIYILTKADRRIWRLRADGILETAAGSTTTPTAGSLDGQPAVSAALDNPSQIVTDGQGRLMFSEARGLFRLEADGTLKLLGVTGAAKPATGIDLLLNAPPVNLIAPGPTAGALVVNVAGHDAYASLPGVDNTGYGSGYVFWRVQEGSGATALTYLQTDPFDYAENTFQLVSVAWDGANAAYVVANSTGTTDDAPPAGWQLLKLDLTTGHTTVVTPYGAEEPVLDPLGNLYSLQGGTVHIKQLITGQDVALAAPAAATAPLMVVGSDKKLYTANGNEVYRDDASGPVRVVGTGSAAASDSALSFFFQTLGGLAVSSDGHLLVGDTGAHKVYQLDAGKQIVPFVDASKFTANPLRLDAAGKLYTVGVDASQIGSVDAQGTWTSVATVPGLVMDFVFGPDGTLYWSSYDFQNRQFLVSAVKGGQTTNLLTGAVQYAVAIDADGKLLVAGDGALRRQSATGFDVVKADAAFDLPRNFSQSQMLAVDAKNRVYLARPDQHTISRYDPASQQLSTLAGPGGKLFTGTSVDDGIKTPCSIVFTGDGDMYFVDTENRQVKHVGAGDLQ